MTYERNEDIIIAVLEMIVSILKGGKKIRVLLKKKKSQASTSFKESDSDTTLASESPSEAEA